MLYNFVIYSPSSDQFPIEFVANEQTGAVLFRELASKYLVNRLCVQNYFTHKAQDTGMEKDANVSVTIFEATMDFVRSAPSEAEVEDDE